MNEEQARKFVESFDLPQPDIGFDQDCDGMRVWKPLDLSWANGKPIPEWAEYKCYTAEAVKKAIVSALLKLGQQNCEVQFFCRRPKYRWRGSRWTDRFHHKHDPRKNQRA